MSFIIHRTREHVAPYLWKRIGFCFAWCSEPEWALRYESREAAEFAALGLEGVEVVEVPCQPS